MYADTEKGGGAAQTVPIVYDLPKTSLKPLRMLQVIF